MIETIKNNFTDIVYKFFEFNQIIHSLTRTYLCSISDFGGKNSLKNPIGETRLEDNMTKETGTAKTSRYLENINTKRETTRIVRPQSINIM